MEKYCRYSPALIRRMDRSERPKAKAKMLKALFACECPMVLRLPAGRPPGALPTIVEFNSLQKRDVEEMVNAAAQLLPG